jgi:hypothetical protein
MMEGFGSIQVLVDPDPGGPKKRIRIYNTEEYNSKHKKRIPSFLYIANIGILDIQNTVPIVAKPPLPALMTELTRSRLLLITFPRN